jgi:CRP-like cAMP-binding protein
LAVSQLDNEVFDRMSLSPERNQLLGALQPSDREYLKPHLHKVRFSLGQVVWESGERLTTAYFLIGSIVSLLYTMENGTTAAMGLVGDDGMLGLSIFLGSESSWCRAVVAAGGEALAVPAATIRDRCLNGPSFRAVLLRYTQALLTQVSQTAACNRLHSVEQRLSRWLLLCHDRIGRRELLMTQELIAHMLGVRRESVTVAARHLQDLGIIHYCRGHITILDRAGLEAASCECYRAVENELDRLFATRRFHQVSRPADAVRSSRLNNLRS